MIWAEADYQIMSVIDQTGTRTQKVENENKKVKAVITEMQAAIKKLQGALARADEDKQWELAEKDKIITELIDAIIRQGVAMEGAKKVLEQARRERDEAQAEAQKLRAGIANIQVAAEAKRKCLETASKG